jgi:hypothetical protein
MGLNFMEKRRVSLLRVWRQTRSNIDGTVCLYLDAEIDAR